MKNLSIYICCILSFGLMNCAKTNMNSSINLKNNIPKKVVIITDAFDANLEKETTLTGEEKNKAIKIYLEKKIATSKKEVTSKNKITTPGIRTTSLPVGFFTLEFYFSNRERDVMSFLESGESPQYELLNKSDNLWIAELARKYKSKE